MTQTFEQWLAARSRPTHVDVRIEGFGAYLDGPDTIAANFDARYRLSFGQQPSYAAGQPAHLWRPILCTMPDLTGESVDLFGGFPRRLGGLTLELLDHRDFLTDLMRTEAGAVAVLDEDLDSSETAITVASAAGIADDSLIFIGGECMAVDSIAGAVLTVRRGWAGTDARAHLTGDRVYAYTRHLLGRRAVVVLAPEDATDADEEQVVGEYVIDGCSWSRDLNRWILTGKSQLKYLDRALPRIARTGTISRVEGNYLFLEQVQGETNVFNWRHWIGSNLDSSLPPTTAFIEVDGEIIGASPAFRTGLQVTARGLLGTAQTDLAVGQRVTQVFVASRDVPGASFRVARGPSPSDDLGTDTDWVKTDHWVDLILALLTSPASAFDPFGPGGNYDAAYDNWSVLPVGFGLGIPAALIDFASFVDARARTADFRFPNFVLGRGEAPRSVADLLDEFLKCLGAYLYIDGQRIGLALPRLPLLGEQLITITADDVLTDGAEPRLAAATNTELHAPGVTYVVGPTNAEITFTNAEYGDTYGQRGDYVTDRDPARIYVPSGDPALRHVYGARAEARLYRLHRPNIQLDLDLDPEQAWNLTPGTVVGVTLGELVDRANGVRGWTSVVGEVLTRQPQLDANEGPSVRASIITYGPSTKVARVTPAAIITAVSTNTVTVAANRYTATDAVGYPDQDVNGFVVGDVVRIVDHSGADASIGNTQIVQSINPGTNQITLDGDFDSDLQDDLILVYTDYDQATATQHGRFAFAADRATQTVDGGAVAPYLFGEL